MDLHDYPEQGYEELSGVPDADLGAAYYKLRDETRQTEAGTYYPNLESLVGTAFEREKDRREVQDLVKQDAPPEMQAWYEEARQRPCVWWLDNHLVARHSLKSCLYCGVCTSQCPAAQYFEEYNPRIVVDVALARDEDRLIDLLKSDVLWYCGQCGSCRAKCPRENNVMGLVSSLRFLSQLKGYHLASVRGRQQYAARHLWGANLWNRALSLYFRNAKPQTHQDFGPRYEQYWEEAVEQMRRLGASPDARGDLAGKKVEPETLAQVRRCLQWGGTLVLWQALEEYAAAQAAEWGLTIDEYYEKVRSEG
ncbi:MAG TPA: 4Fe-4S dicluster domain-containing protein [Phycisphaerae bacterium]|nr:4Fe-4S dicluster domain-containing protein [Phycisphaerae bacterium]